MINFLPIYFILGFVASKLWIAGSHGLAGALIVAASWLAVSSFFAARRQVKAQKFKQEVQSILKEKGY